MRLVCDHPGGRSADSILTTNSCWTMWCYATNSPCCNVPSSGARRLAPLSILTGRRDGHPWISSVFRGPTAKGLLYKCNSCSQGQFMLRAQARRGLAGQLQFERRQQERHRFVGLGVPAHYQPPSIGRRHFQVQHLDLGQRFQHRAGRQSWRSAVKRWRSVTCIQYARKHTKICAPTRASTE